ncbi:MAG: glycosyltransferase, partial [Mariniblastus sp.]|nr:glycosyltransferase [Mariniblastus sp.]
MSLSSVTKIENLVSVIVPVFNELENVELMYREMIGAMENQDRPFELVVVDDGSLDGTREKLIQIAADDERVKLILFRRNYGQTAAMHAGIQNASGDYLVTIDGDLQNDPHDIPMMLD